MRLIGMSPQIKPVASVRAVARGRKKNAGSSRTAAIDSLAVVDETELAAVDEADVATADIYELGDDTADVDGAEVPAVDEVEVDEIDEVGDPEMVEVDEDDEADLEVADDTGADLEVADEDNEIEVDEVKVGDAELAVADEDDDAELAVADEDDDAELAVADEDDEAELAVAEIDDVAEVAADIDEPGELAVDETDEAGDAEVAEVEEDDEADLEVADETEAELEVADEDNEVEVDEVGDAELAVADEDDEAELAVAEIDDVAEVAAVTDEAEVAEEDTDEALVAEETTEDTDEAEVAKLDEAEVAAADMINKAELAALAEVDVATVAIAETEFSSAGIINEQPRTEHLKFGVGLIRFVRAGFRQLRRPWYRRLLPRWLKRLLPPWLRRHWWVLALCFLAGLSGGYEARSSAKVMYSASAELIVESGAGPLGPGSANDANALALSDASIIPSDEATLALVAAETGTPLAEVTKSVTAEAVSGTSVINVSFKAKNASNAIADVNDVAQALSAGGPGAAIPTGSLVVVQLASTTSRVGLVHSYGIPIGVILGLFIGGIAVLAIERADPRVDDVEDLARITGTTASAFPGPLPMVELAWNIALASGDAPDVTLVPLSRAEEAQAEILWRYLTMGANQPTLLLNFAASSKSPGSFLAQGSGPTVVVVRPNTRARVLQASVLRLQMLGRSPVWAVLAVGELVPKSKLLLPEIELLPESKLLPESTR
jgi:hypothetical protein